MVNQNETGRESYEVKYYRLVSSLHQAAVIWRGPMASKALNQMILMQIG
jgi:Mrp family chromosome partitioning ATPase